MNSDTKLRRGVRDLLAVYGRAGGGPWPPDATWTDEALLEAMEYALLYNRARPLTAEEMQGATWDNRDWDARPPF